jgi:hypothetical protein
MVDLGGPWWTLVDLRSTAISTAPAYTCDSLVDLVDLMSITQLYEVRLV